MIVYVQYQVLVLSPVHWNYLGICSFMEEASFNPKLLFSTVICRNRGPAWSRHFWASVQPVEKQRVCVSQLQPEHRCLTICSSPGEMPRHGPQQQSHCQPQV